MKQDKIVDYLMSLKHGERVIEMGQCCTKGFEGTVYIKKGYPFVQWDAQKDMQTFGTSATSGTRRISDNNNH